MTGYLGQPCHMNHGDMVHVVEKKLIFANAFIFAAKKRIISLIIKRLSIIDSLLSIINITIL